MLPRARSSRESLEATRAPSPRDDGRCSLAAQVRTPRNVSAAPDTGLCAGVPDGSTRNHNEFARWSAP